jgi:ATP-dependent RNA helicase RhlE
MNTFEDLKLTRQFLNAVEDAGYTTTTPIQEKAIPLILGGAEVIGIAQTGTGKTAAYVLPILQMVKFKQGDHPRALIIVPTKELAIQVHEQVVKLAKYTDIRSVVLYGGVGKTPQLNALLMGSDVIISTPKRLFELYEEGALVLKLIKTLVLDEADRMMDMGFLPQLNLLLDILPRRRQNLLFSATFSAKVEKLSENFLEIPIKIEITPEATPVETVTQIRYNVPNIATKLNLIEFILKDPKDSNKVIIFAKTKETTNFIVTKLERKYKNLIGVVHSNKDQNARINAIKKFTSGEYRLLVCTDIASRGLDIPLVTHVINFDVPIVYEDYVHRIGRTGRALNEGTALTFVNISEAYHFEQIEKKIRMPIPPTDLPAGVPVAETPFEEQQNYLMEIDARKQKADPTYKGAFHSKSNPKADHKQSGRKKKLEFRSSASEKASTKPKTSKHGRYNKDKRG